MRRGPSGDTPKVDNRHGHTFAKPFVIMDDHGQETTGVAHVTAAPAASRRGAYSTRFQGWWINMHALMCTAIHYRGKCRDRSAVILPGAPQPHPDTFLSHR